MMSQFNLSIKRLALLLVAVLGMTSVAWASGFGTPQLFNETGIGVASQPHRGMLQGNRQALEAAVVGDVDRDGSMNIADVTSLIDALLSGYVGPLNGDVDGDGIVSIADVTNLIDRLLTGTVETRLSTVELALTLGDIYRSMHTAGWSTLVNTHQCFGISAYNLMAELMGEDFIMGAMGSGWFWYDAGYNMKTRYTSVGFRSYDLWMAYYTWIAEANSIIAKKNEITGDAAKVNYYVGQAYAIRAYSYFMLAQTFARTYKGHESEPCVPIFNGTAFTGSTGQARSTVTQVYAQINSDITQAINLLNGTTQLKPDHIGYAVAKGLQARIALVKEDWATAYSAAVAAINASGKSIQNVSDFMGMNDVTAGNVLWGADIPTQENGEYGSLWSHMLPDEIHAYGLSAPQQISKWLYNKMSATDTRLNLWKPNSTGVGSDAYIQNKFDVLPGTVWDGDYIYMRVEEMYLTAAEAACRRGQTTTAKNYLNQLMAKRVPGYTCSKTGTSLGALTTDETGSLLEEILIQRRLELWGEDGRIYTIRRLRQGFERTTDNGWPLSLTGGHAWNDPECYAWVLTIPQSEFDGNSNMDEVVDQNPLGDYSANGQNVTFETASMSVNTVQYDQSIPVKLKRTNTNGSYIIRLKVVESDIVTSKTVTATFADGSNEVQALVPFDGMDLGTNYYCVLQLSPIDVTGSSSQITQTRIDVVCVNGDPTGQKISFESATMDVEAERQSMSISIPLTRAITTGDYRATVSKVEGDEQMMLYSEAVIFQNGQNRGTTSLWVKDMEKGKTYTCKLRLSDADAATGGQITTMVVTVTRSTADWVYLGICVYDIGMFGSNSYYMTVQRDGTTNRYRMLNFAEEGYNIVFTIDDSNKVYIESQPSFDYSQYGTCYMMGYANADDTGYAGNYDPNTKKAELEVRYYYPGIGAYPTSSDVLTMP